ncbi:uncharacterized protein LOC121373548 [Gigantopelta aegis]|uniref:uncharacterized protein LOC121373548 n=1 Tax=Gigantopelta aegis TaxID=1735272 RepID=UPI001B88BF4A|nr:uncharacterized protein LOC121373548 [Gigantopelta aegis]
MRIFNLVLVLSLFGLSQCILPLLAPIIGAAVGPLLQGLIGDIGALFSGKSGDLAIPNSKIKLHYNIHKCRLHIGKRAFLSGIERCKVTVCENQISHSCQSCTKHKQADALKCAMNAEVAHLQALAKG